MYIEIWLPGTACEWPVLGVMMSAVVAVCYATNITCFVIV